MTGPERYSFGVFTLDVPERRLSRDDGPVALAPKALDVLIALVRHAGGLVTKDDLLESVWPDCFVEEGILTVHVSDLRKVLADANKPFRYIETVPRSGYRFTAPVVVHSPAAHVDRARHAAGGRVYELLGRGRFHLLSASMSEVPKAVAVFQSAIEIDPTYAAAHAGLALAWCAQAELRVAPTADAYREAKAAALRALALDDSSADAHVALGAVLFLSEWHWEGAERSLKRALALSHNHTEAMLLYGRLLEALGRLQEGLDMKLRALERDPFSPLVHLQIAMSYWNQRRYDDAIEWATRTLDLDPRHLGAREFLAGSYLMMGDANRYMAESLAHAASYGVAPDVLDPLKHAFADGGRAGIVRYTIQQLASQEPRPPALQLALFYGEAGDLDAAFAHLDRAIEGRDPCLVHLAVAPQWDPLRADSRFRERLERMGFTGEGEERRRYSTGVREKKP